MPTCVNEKSASFNDDRIFTRSSFLVPNPFDASGASFPFPFSLCLSHLGGPTACRSPSLKRQTPTTLSFDPIPVDETVAQCPVLMVSTLPTTVNMCVILTGSADGSVASSLCNAAIGNVVGGSHHARNSAAYVRVQDLHSAGDRLLSLASRVALPVCVGQLLRLTPVEIGYDSRAKFFKRTQVVILC
jgi:SBF-like CPA transporter family (DUF4137)